jgi:hypothetical protein
MTMDWEKILKERLLARIREKTVGRVRAILDTGRMVEPTGKGKVHAVKNMVESRRDENKGSFSENLENSEELLTIASVLPFVDFLLHLLQLSLYRLPTDSAPPVPILPHPSFFPRCTYPPFPLVRS